MLTSLAFIAFYYFSYFCGRGILIIIESKSKVNLKDSSLFNIPIKIFSPIVYIFYIGNLVLIFNFFSGFNFLTYLLGIFPIFFNFKAHRKLEINKYLFFYKNITLLILGLSSNTIYFHQDSASYHLSNQLFIRSEKIVLGLANLHVRYGFSSISEYINSFFWFNDNFLLLHFVNLIFVATFFIFLLNITVEFEKNKLRVFFILVTLFAIFDNFGIEGGKNGYFDIDSIGKQDTAFAIIFFFANFFIIQGFINTKTFNPKEFLFIQFFVLFSLQLKIFGFTALIGLFIFIIKNKKFVKLKHFTISSILGLIWIMKNYLVSSCLVFPVSISCLPSKWFHEGFAKSQNAELREFHKAYDFINQNIFQWYENWSSRYLNYYISINLFVSFSLLLIVGVILYKKRNNFVKVNQLSFLYITLLFFTWLISSPTIRFGYGIFLVLILIISNLFEIERSQIIKNIINKKITFLSLYLFAVVSTPLFNNYDLTFFISPLREIRPEIIKYTKNLDNWGYSVSNNENQDIEFCWINKNCIPPSKYKILEDNLNNYRLIYVEK